MDVQMIGVNYFKKIMAIFSVYMLNIYTNIVTANYNTTQHSNS